jgi:hypothetical protein
VTDQKWIAAHRLPALVEHSDETSVLPPMFGQRAVVTGLHEPFLLPKVNLRVSLQRFESRGDFADERSDCERLLVNSNR